jgi:hypothetical protein
MYVSSDAPLPQNSMSPMDPVRSAQYNQRKQTVWQSVLWAASRYACTSPVDSNSFANFGVNLQYEVARAQKLLNLAGSQMSPRQMTRASVTSSDPSDAPQVIPLNPVDTNPKPSPAKAQIGPWDAPAWGDASVALPGCNVQGGGLLQMLQSNPWWAVGGLAAAALAVGAFGVSSSRRRRAA